MLLVHFSPFLLDTPTRQTHIRPCQVIAGTNSMTYSSAMEFEVPRADPRRRARGAAGFGTEATVLWGPTRSKAARFSTRRLAPEGRPGGPEIRHSICVSSAK